jgi:enoyl-[acyl-carrier-protein] reductase (NADH)
MFLIQFYTFYTVYSINKKVLERTNSPTFLSLFNNLHALQRYDVAENYKIYSVVQRLSQKISKLGSVIHLKALSNKIMIQTELVAMCTTFCCAKFNFSECDGS